MNNAISNNFLTKDELFYIKKVIESEINKRKSFDSVLNGQDVKYNLSEYTVRSSDMGRITLRNLPLTKSISDKFFKYAKEITGLTDLIKSGNVFAEYNAKYGTPCLMPHYDVGEPNVLLDYQVYSNIDWPLIINQKEYLCKDNSVLNIYNVSQMHYRVPKVFNNNDYLGVLFFNYFSPSLKINKTISDQDFNDIAKEVTVCQKNLNQSA